MFRVLFRPILRGGLRHRVKEARSLQSRDAIHGLDKLGICKICGLRHLPGTRAEPCSSLQDVMQGLDHDNHE